MKQPRTVADSSRLEAERLEESSPPRRDFVTHFEALGEPELLQLHHIGLERLGVATDALRQFRGRGTRILFDKSQRLLRPGAMGAALIELCELLFGCTDFLVRQVSFESEGNSVAVAAIMEAYEE